MRTAFRHLLSDRGTTLVEVIVTVVIMGIAFTAILGGVATQIIVSDVHRKQATAQTALRSYAEAVQAKSSWPDCFSATPANVTANYGPAAVNYTAPSSYSAAATAVQFWDGAAFQSTCTKNPGSILVSIQVSDASNKATESMDVVALCSGKRTSAGGPCP